MGEHKLKAASAPAPAPTVRRVPASKLSEIHELQHAVEEASSRVQIAQAELSLAVERFRSKVRSCLREQGAPITHSIADDGEIVPPPAPGK